MANITLNLPAVLKQFVDSEVAARGFGNAADYVQAVLREEQKRKARDKVEALMDEAMASGESTEWTRQDFEDMKQEIRVRHQGSPQ
jgi:antitoxin ParD1/3/4